MRATKGDRRQGRSPLRSFLFASLWDRRSDRSQHRQCELDGVVIEGVEDFVALETLRSRLEVFRTEVAGGQ
jgi:hypothetical protein